MQLKFRVFILFLLFSLIGCGPQSQNSDTQPCAPNVIDNGLQLLVTNVGNNNYEFKLCAPANPASTYTVYGAIDASMLTPNNIIGSASWRLKSITDSNSTGNVFQVQFHPDDKAFAIYQDNPKSIVSPPLDITKPMVSARALPGF